MDLTGSIESGKIAQNIRMIPVDESVVKADFLRAQRSKPRFELIISGMTKVTIGTIPTIINEAAICQVARNIGPVESIVSNESPDNAPPPMDVIISSNNHQGIPLALEIGPPLRALTIFRWLVANEVNQIVAIEIRKP